MRELQSSWAARESPAGAPWALDDEPLPSEYQSAIPPDYSAFLPDSGGQFPVGPQLVSMARGLAPELVELELPDRQSLTIANRASHTHFRVQLAAGAETVLLPEELWRSYLLILNVGAVPVLLGFGGKGAGDGLPLGAAGGFLELTIGSVSEIRAVAVGGVGAVAVVEGYQFPYPGDRRAERLHTWLQAAFLPRVPAVTPLSVGALPGGAVPGGWYIVPLLGRHRVWIDGTPPPGSIPAG